MGTDKLTSILSSNKRKVIDVDQARTNMQSQNEATRIHKIESNDQTSEEKEILARLQSPPMSANEPQ